MNKIIDARKLLFFSLFFLLQGFLFAQEMVPRRIYIVNAASKSIDGEKDFQREKNLVRELLLTRLGSVNSPVESSESVSDVSLSIQIAEVKSGYTVEFIVNDLLQTNEEKEKSAATKKDIFTYNVNRLETQSLLKSCIDPFTKTIANRFPQISQRVKTVIQEKIVKDVTYRDLGEGVTVTLMLIPNSKLILKNGTVYIAGKDGKLVFEKVPQNSQFIAVIQKEAYYSQEEVLEIGLESVDKTIKQDRIPLFSVAIGNQVISRMGIDISFSPSPDLYELVVGLDVNSVTGPVSSSSDPYLAFIQSKFGARYRLTKSEEVLQVLLGARALVRFDENRIEPGLILSPWVPYGFSIETCFQARVTPFLNVGLTWQPSFMYAPGIYNYNKARALGLANNFWSSAVESNNYIYDYQSDIWFFLTGDLYLSLAEIRFDVVLRF